MAVHVIEEGGLRGELDGENESRSGNVTTVPNSNKIKFIENRFYNTSRSKRDGVYWSIFK